MPPARRVCVSCELRRQVSSFASERARVCNVCKRNTRRAHSRSARLMDVYGITADEYAALLRYQRGCCAGCGGTRRYNLHVDHDHAIERRLLDAGWAHPDAARESVRGLLCAACNKILRDARDDTARLVRLAGYLRRPPARKVLL